MHAGRAELECCSDLPRLAVPAGQPEGEADLDEHFEIRNVTISIDRFTGVADLDLASRRGIVSAGGRSFDDETINLSAGFANQSGRKDMR